MHRSVYALIASALLWSCGGSPKSLGLIYVRGRAVEPVGDSLLAMTAVGIDGLLLYHLRSGAIDTIGSEALDSPLQVQQVDGRWYVSDIRDGRPQIVVLSWDGALERRIDLGDISSRAHQFAVLPGGRVVVESADLELLQLDGDSITSFALIETGARPSLLAGVAGGVLHAVPGKHMTLYNEFGNIRWRVEWPWAVTAYFTDISVDRQGRIHMMAGVPGDSAFRVYTVARDDGDIIAWSPAGPYGTFIVDRRGGFRPDSASRWLGN